MTWKLDFLDVASMVVTWRMVAFVRCVYCKHNRTKVYVVLALLALR